MTKRKKKGSGATAAIVIIVIAVLIAAAVVFALAFRNETNSPSDPDDTAGTSDVVVNDSNDTAGNENSANVVGTADSQTTDTTDEVTEDVTPDEHIEITDITVNENFKYSNGGTVSLSIQAPKLVSETYGENGFASPAELLEWLIANQPEEDYVLVHGDFCLPNIFMENGTLSGFIDIGSTGIADRWQDIALCYRSLKNNFGGRYRGKVYADFDPDILFDALQIKPDWDKIRYYLLLDELF